MAARWIEEHENKAKALFADTDVHITINGKRHLGTALGANTFTEEYVSSKVREWVKEITHLSAVAITQPHAAYAAFTHGLSSHWTYISRTIPGIQDLLRPPELQEQHTQDIQGQLNPQLQRSVELARERGTSAWLTVLPVAEHGFLLHKGEFRDALCLRYGWNLRNTPISCNCGSPFSVDHAMTCHMGGIPTIRHNEIQDITATRLTDICHNVATEPLLRPVTNESFAHRSANTEPNARLDIRARGFWSTGQDTFLMSGFSTQTRQATAP